MKKIILTGLTCIATSALSSAATVISVTNAGFEAQTVADGQNNSQSSTSFYDGTTSNSGDGSITGWTESNTTTQLGYVINPGGGFTQPTGNNAALVMNQTLSQTLNGFTLNTGDTVTVEFDVWRGNAGTGSTLLINFAGLGTQAASGVTQSISSQSFDFVITSDGVTTGDLSFQSTIGGNDYRIDNVSVSYETAAVPEPSASALLGLGGLALILRRRK